MEERNISDKSQKGFSSDDYVEIQWGHPANRPIHLEQPGTHSAIRPINLEQVGSHSANRPINLTQPGPSTYSSDHPSYVKGPSLSLSNKHMDTRTGQGSSAGNRLEGQRSCASTRLEGQQGSSSSGNKLPDGQHQEALASRDGKQQGKKRARNELEWKRNVRKHARTHGLEYVTRAGKLKPKKMPLPVTCNCRYSCQEFTEETRTIICNEYYAIGDSTRQKDFIVSRISIEPVKRRVQVRKNQQRQMRGNSYVYFLGLRNKDGVPEMLRVCQNFFCRTLAISGEVVRNALNNIGIAGNYVGVDKRKGRQPKNKIDDERKNFVKDHINSFPRINKKFLASELNVAKMHRLYVEQCHTKGVEPVKESMYRHIFVAEFDLQFLVPTKEQCTGKGEKQQETRAAPPPPPVSMKWPPFGSLPSQS